MGNAGLFNAMADRDRISILLENRKVRVLLDADLVVGAQAASLCEPRLPSVRLSSGEGAIRVTGESPGLR